MKPNSLRPKSSRPNRSLTIKVAIWRLPHTKRSQAYKLVREIVSNLEYEGYEATARLSRTSNRRTT